MSAWVTRVCAVVAVCVPLAAQTASPADTVRELLGHAKVTAALHALERDHDRFVREIVTLTEIPAPPFQEQARAAAFLRMLRQARLADVHQDAEGNVIGRRKGSGAGPLLAVAAHLDTVFPAGTDVRVKRSGTTLAAPGIGDNTRSLAALLAMARAMDAARIVTTSDILFIGNVGEEGPGDLRGVRHLFLEGPYKDRIGQFVSIDGAGAGHHIVHGAVGSRRYRVAYGGPGGHSYGSFGLVNPAFALANALHKFSRLAVPASPRTTFNVGVIGGGTSVNSIPAEAWAEIDLRSESQAELDRIEQEFLAFMRQAAEEENRARSITLGEVTVDLELIGDRPSGVTPLDAPIVQIAAEVVRASGGTPSFGAASTDANIPISLGIPAITIDSGGSGSRAHSLDEWIDVEVSSSLPGLRRALTTVLALAGVE